MIEIAVDLFYILWDIVLILGILFLVLCTVAGFKKASAKYDKEFDEWMDEYNKRMGKE